MLIARIACAVWILLVCLCGAHAQQPEWRKFETAHFTLYTKEGEPSARQVLEHLERVRATYQLLTGSKMETPERPRVVLFGSKGEYQPYAMPGYSDAYYMNGWGRDHIVLSGLKSDWQRVLNHEYFHLFSRHAGFRLPVWLEEGLADYYSTMRMTDKDVSVGLPVDNHLKFLNSAAGSPAPLGSIFAVSRSTRHSADLRSTLLLYAQGWALTHMTFMDAQFRPRADEFFRLMKDGADAYAAYQSVYGLSSAELDKRFLDYLSRSRYAYTRQPVAGLAAEVTVGAATAAEWEVPLLLANLQAMVQRRDEAARAYRSLADRFPDEPEIDASLGYLALLEMDRPAAARHFEDAVKKGSTNPRVFRQLAQLRCNYQSGEQQCLDWIEQSLRLDPGDREARRWAAGFALNARRFEVALRYMAEGGAVPAPEAPEFFYRYAYALANLDRTEEARTAIRRGLEFATKPADVQRLRELATMLEASVAYSAQVQQFPSGAAVPAPPQPSRQKSSLQTGADRTGGDGSPADEAMAAFLGVEGARVVTGVIQKLDCRQGTLQLAVASGPLLTLGIDNISTVQVFAEGEALEDRESVCRLLVGQRALVGYLAGEASDERAGLLRLLSLP